MTAGFLCMWILNSLRELAEQTFLELLLMLRLLTVNRLTN